MSEAIKVRAIGAAVKTEGAGAGTYLFRTEHKTWLIDQHGATPASADLEALVTSGKWETVDPVQVPLNDQARCVLAEDQRAHDHYLDQVRSLWAGIEPRLESLSHDRLARICSALREAQS